MEGWAQIITAIMPLLLAIVAGFVAIYAKVDGVHKQINSRMDELVASTRALAHAQGVADERDRAGTASSLHAESVAEGVAQERAAGLGTPPGEPMPVIDTHNDPPRGAN